MRITAIGDLHGTLDNLLDIVMHLGYVDAKLDWIEEDLHFVLTGDCCDRGYNSKDIYTLLIKWQRQAGACGSRLYFVLGNHEVMNIFGYAHYNTEEEYRSFAENPHVSGERAFRTAFSPGGWVYNWLMNQEAVHKIGDFIFSHGDLPAALSGSSVEEINKSIKAPLLTIKHDSLSEEEADPLFSEERSVLWCRQAQYSRISRYGDRLEEFLEKNGGKIYICGHTPSQSGTFTHLYGGRYLCIDTAMVFVPRGMGSVSYLTFHEGVLLAHYLRGKSFLSEELPLP